MQTSRPAPASRAQTQPPLPAIRKARWAASRTTSLSAACARDGASGRPPFSFSMSSGSSSRPFLCLCANSDVDGLPRTYNADTGTCSDAPPPAPVCLRDGLLLGNRFFVPGQRFDGTSAQPSLALSPLLRRHARTHTLRRRSPAAANQCVYCNYGEISCTDEGEALRWSVPPCSSAPRSAENATDECVRRNSWGDDKTLWQGQCIDAAQCCSAVRQDQTPAETANGFGSPGYNESGDQTSRIYECYALCGSDK